MDIHFIHSHRILSRGMECCASMHTLQTPDSTAKLIDSVPDLIKSETKQIESGLDLIDSDPDLIKSASKQIDSAPDLPVLTLTQLNQGLN